MDAQAFHHVNEQLLIDARDISSPQEEALVTQQVQEAIQRIVQSDHPDYIVCTCSSIGTMAETYGELVLRVDRPMASSAVQSYRTIHVLAALESTLQPTKDLLLEESRKLSVSPTIKMTVVPEAWANFQTGYAETIANYIVKEFGGSNESDDKVVIVLAQASMSPAVELVRKLLNKDNGWLQQVPRILTSPAICMEYLAKRSSIGSQQSEKASAGPTHR